MHRSGFRRCMYQLVGGEDATGFHALLGCWQEYQAAMKVTRSAEQSTAQRRQLHGKHKLVMEQAPLH